MKARDRLIAKRRQLPVTEVDTDYRFIGPNGDTDLLGLFQGRRQLIIYRFFYAPAVENWPDGACSGCSMFADTVAHPAHMAARDTTLVFVTAAPVDHIERLRKRMGWGHIPFYSLPDGRFSKDFDVEDLFGLNVFIQKDGRVYRTFFLNGRGIEEIGSVFSFLDMTLLGRQEKWQDAPEGWPQGDPYIWWRLHDHYGEVAAPTPQEKRAPNWPVRDDLFPQGNFHHVCCTTLVPADDRTESMDAVAHRDFCPGNRALVLW